MNVIYPSKKQLYFIVLSCGTRKDSMWHAFSYVTEKGRMKKKIFLVDTRVWLISYYSLLGGELFMHLEREGVFLEDTAW